MHPDSYIDHPPQIPVELAPLGPQADTRLTDSTRLGGIRLRGTRPGSPSRMTVGQCLRLRIPDMGPDAWADMRVSWQHPTHHGYELGLDFLNADQAFRMRLLEQLCHIICYRRRVWRHEGRRLDSNQAAREWIDRFADCFPAVTP